MRPFLFLIGAPGAGKTTVTRALLGTPTSTVARWTVGQNFAAAGPYTGAVLDGPDALPYSNALLAKVLERGLLLPSHLIAIFDGERFGAWALEALRGRARAVGVFLQASIATLKCRRAARGSPAVTDGWIQRRIDRGTQLFATIGDRHVVGAERPLADVVAAVKGCCA